MLRFFVGFLFFFSLAVGAAEREQSAAPAADPYAYVSLSNYRLAPGDMISVRVLGEEELSREKVRLTDAGTVPMPAVGEIQVLGLTIKDVERVVANSLRGRYLVNPKVSVIIEEYRPFYINGMVAKPGAYAYQPGMTVRKAASVAGGFTERASLEKVFVIREAAGNKTPTKISVDTEVLPGDIVTIEESFF